MIRRIELVNFMSHDATVIEPSDGLTVLVGPNNCGKSAVVTALQILATNDNSTYVLRHNESDCTVTVTTSDPDPSDPDTTENHIVQWGRTRDAPRYVIDGVRFDRLGRGAVPDELHAALRLPKVVTDDDRKFDVHFGGQKSPIFLLNDPPSHAAQFFASSSDAATLIAMQNLHQKRTADAKREQKELSAQLLQFERELAALEPVDALVARVCANEEAYQEIARTAIQVQQCEAVSASLLVAINAVDRAQSRATVLARVPAPPVMGDEAALAHTFTSLATAHRNQRNADAVRRAVRLLSIPPAMGDTAGLSQCLRSLDAATQSVVRTRKLRTAVESLTAPPALARDTDLRVAVDALAGAHETARRTHCLRTRLAPLKPLDEFPAPRPLRESISAIEQAAALVDEHSTGAQSARTGLALLALEIARWVQEHPSCPICGSSLDASRLVSHFHDSSAERPHD